MLVQPSLMYDVVLLSFPLSVVTHTSLSDTVPFAWAMMEAINSQTCRKCEFKVGRMNTTVSPG